MDNSSGNRARIIKPLSLLQQKTGLGSVDDESVERSQEIIDQNQTDFIPLALEFLGQLEQAIKSARNDSSLSKEDALQAMTVPVMQIKANAAMFDYELVTTLANIILSFLESIDKADKDIIDLVETHYKTLSLIVNNRMEGDGADKGDSLIAETKDAVRRYHAKHGK